MSLGFEIQNGCQYWRENKPEYIIQNFKWTRNHIKRLCNTFLCISDITEIISEVKNTQASVLEPKNIKMAAKLGGKITSKS